jgi:hypothetical protein
VRSPDGVVGSDVFGLYVPLSCVDAFLVDADGISFSQEVRRVGFEGWDTLADDGRWRGWSVSSSEDARASESGVDRLMPGLALSSKAVL